MKRILALALALVMVFALCACGNNSAPAASNAPETQTPADAPEAPAEVITIKMAEASASTHISCQTQNKFKELIEEKSNGHIVVELYQDGTLGTEVETWDMIQQGTIQMLTAGSGSEASFMPAYQITGAPYIFSSYEQFSKTTMDETGLNMFNAGLKETKDARLLNIWERGARNLTANKEIVHPEDVAGLKVRVPGNEVYLATWEALGANIVSMPYAEVYTALNQGTADAQENPVETILAGSFYEVQKYMMTTEHVYSCGYVIINDSFFSGLSAEDQQLIVDCVEAARQWNDEKFEAEYDDMVQQLVDNGMTVVEIDNAEWQESLAYLIEEFETKFGWDADFDAAVLAARDK